MFLISKTTSLNCKIYKVMECSFIEDNLFFLREADEIARVHCKTARTTVLDRHINHYLHLPCTDLALSIVLSDLQ